MPDPNANPQPQPGQPAANPNQPPGQGQSAPTPPAPPAPPTPVPPSPAAPASAPSTANPAAEPGQPLSPASTTPPPPPPPSPPSPPSPPPATASTSPPPAESQAAAGQTTTSPTAESKPPPASNMAPPPPPPSPPAPPPPGKPAAAASAASRARKPGINIKIVLIAIVALLLIGALVFSVFNYLQSNPGTNLLGGKPSKTQPVTLTYWGLWEPESVMKPIIEEYQQLHPNVTIKYQQSSPIEYGPRLRNALANGQNPPDIFRIHNTWTYMLGQYLEPMPESVYSESEYNQTFYSVAGRSLKYYDKIIAVPLMYEGLAMYYNVDLLNQAGIQPPQTWTEVQQAAQRLTVRQGNRIQIAGAALGGVDNIDHWSDIVTLMIYQAGGKPYDPNDSDKVGKPLTFYGLFGAQYRVWDETLPQATTYFALGKTGLYFGPSWDYFVIKQIAQDNGVELNFRIRPMPQLTAQTQVGWASFWAEAVSNRAAKPNREEAWKFIKYLSQKETMQKLYAQQSKIRDFGEIPARKDLADEYLDHPWIGPYLKQAENSVTFPTASATRDKEGINDRMIQAYEPVVKQVIRGEAPNLQQLDKAVKDVLKDYGLN